MSKKVQKGSPIGPNVDLFCQNKEDLVKQKNERADLT
jgi:hypothetical protein